MTHRSRRLCATALSIGSMCSLAACGSSSSSSGSAGTAPPSGRAAPAGFTLTAAERSCLKKKGVTLPSGGIGRGSRPTGANARHGTLPKGKSLKAGAPGAAHGAFAQNSKRQAALKACGVTFPTRPGAPPATTTG